MRHKTREEVVKQTEERTEMLVKDLFERFVREERWCYLENHRKLTVLYLRPSWPGGAVEDLKVPRVQEGDFHP